MKSILPILALVCTVLATLTALVFCMAGGANSTPAQIRALKIWMAGISLLGIAGVVVGIVLIRAGQPNWASLAAFAPTVIFGIILLVAELTRATPSSGELDDALALVDFQPTLAAFEKIFTAPEEEDR